MEADMGLTSEAARVKAANLKLQVDSRIPLQHYYDLAADLFHQASIHRRNKTVMELYIMLLRFSGLVLETIPHHRDYMVKHSKQRKDLTKKAHFAKEELEFLKPKIKCPMDKHRDGSFPEDGETIQMILAICPEGCPHPDEGPIKVDVQEHVQSITSTTYLERLDTDIAGILTPDHDEMDRDASKGLSTALVNSSLNENLKLNNSDLHLEEKSFLDSQLAPVGCIEAYDSPMERNLDDTKEDQTIDKKYCAQLQHLVADVLSLTQEIFGLIYSSQQYEKDVKDAVHQAKWFASLYKKEVRERKKEKEVLRDLMFQMEDLRCQHDKLQDELHNVQEERAKMETNVTILEDQLKDSKYLAESMLQEKDDTKQKLNTLRLRLLSRSFGTPNMLSFSLVELEQATFNFDSSVKIGQGRSATIYQGIIRNTSVAIKRFDEPFGEGQSKFHEEIELLGRVRHPHFLTIIGVCREASSLIYEFLPNRSLEDCLTHKENSSPLSWPARIRIATEVCSALIFLHSCYPAMIHGNLKPTNILLDANFSSKLCDLRTAHSFYCSSSDNSLEHSDEVHAYIAPEFFDSHDLTPFSDVYSFGLIILILLTGLPVSIVVEDVSKALEKGELQYVLDDSAGEWPFILASQLAHLGLRCCEKNPNDRPNLQDEVWRLLQPIMKASSLGSLIFSISPQFLGDDVPSYFMCPILQEIMRDPHVAADGFTYEAEAIKAWFESGHDTSPMTNMKLPKKELLPNRALRSVILEWSQKRRRQL